VQVPRVFVSAHSGAGLPALRSVLAQEASRPAPADGAGEPDAKVHDTPA
jgi:GTPase